MFKDGMIFQLITQKQFKELSLFCAIPVSFPKNPKLEGKHAQANRVKVIFNQSPNVSILARARNATLATPR